jgi:Tol biopolymer transport system component
VKNLALAPVAVVVVLAAACVGSSSATAPGSGGQAPAGATPGSLAFVAAPSGAARANVFVVAPRGGASHAVTRGGPPVSEAAWTADGTQVVFARRSEHTTSTGSGTGYVDVFVLDRGGRPHLIRRCGLACDARSFAWSPDGRRIAFVTNIRSRFTGTAGEIAVMNADGSGIHVVCTEALCGQGLDDPQWSPDGSRLLFSNMGVIGFPSLGILPSRVWVARPDGSDARALTQPHCQRGHPQQLRGCAYDSVAAWSPNGDWIAFSRHNSIPSVRAQPARTVIELMHPDGSDLHALASCTGVLCNQVMSPAWSPDGSRIAYVPKVERSSQIGLVTLAGGRAAIRACARHRCVAPYGLVWAPDGSALGLFGGTRSSTAYVIDATGAGMHAVGHAIQCCLAWLPGRGRIG